MDKIRDLKRGDLLFKEGEPITHVHVVQSGKLILFVERSGRKIEILEAKVSQVLGESALFGMNAKHIVSAEAANPSKIMEVPIEVFKAQIDTSQPGLKLLIKSLVEESKNSRQLIRSLKMEKDSSPCPQFSIPTLFCLLGLVARHSGHVDPTHAEKIKLDWTVLKIFTTRMFKESLIRMQSVIEILKKLGKAEIHFEKNEDEIDEIVAVTLTDVSLIEEFAEFYQYNLYKPGKSEIIYVDAMALKVATALVEVGKDENVDFRGAVKINYEIILKQVKDQFKFDLKTLHLDSLEKKGLFVKRQPNDKGQVFLSYDKVEFNNMLRYWQIISEIDKWNQKGFVDLKEQAEKVSEVSGDESHCPSCDGPVSNQQKFCPGCGFKLMAA